MMNRRFLAARLLPAVAALLAVWSFVPVGVWWADTPPSYYDVQWSLWGWGSLLTLGVGIVLLVLTRGGVALGLAAIWRWQEERIGSRSFAIGAALLLALLSLLACWLVAEGNPRSVDGYAQLFHARIFLAGQTSLPAPPQPASFGTLHVVFGPDRWFSQYPPGQTLLLAAGLALGSWWLLLPAAAALFALTTYRVARWCADEPTARLTALLACLSPFVVLLAGSELSHVPATAFGMLAASLAIGVAGRRDLLAGAGAGAALGAMLAFRPLDAVAAAVPVACIALLATPRRTRALLAIAAGGVLGTLPLLWFNHATTGNAFQLGYTLAWSGDHFLGFHAVPWGVPLTPVRALGLVGVDLHQLNIYLFDLPIPILLVVAAGLLLGRRALAVRDLVPLAGVVSVLALYYFYWHRDVFYGPRLVFGAVPWLLVLTARALVLLARSGREWRDGVTWGGAAAAVVALAFVVGLATISPERLRGYRQSAPVANLDPERDAAAAGVRDAVVLVPDGWGSRLITRMWSMGVTMYGSTRLYKAIDACTLDLALEEARRNPAKRARILATLDSLAALGRPGVETSVTEDPHLRLPASAVAGAPLPAKCIEELRLDQPGFLNYPRFLWLNDVRFDGDVVWVRDQGRWNDEIARRFAGRRFYRYGPVVAGGPPVFTPLDAYALAPDRD
jgi:hypothetical protein